MHPGEVLGREKVCGLSRQSHLQMEGRGTCLDKETASYRKGKECAVTTASKTERVRIMRSLGAQQTFIVGGPPAVGANGGCCLPSVTVSVTQAGSGDGTDLPTGKLLHVEFSVNEKEEYCSKWAELGEGLCLVCHQASSVTLPQDCFPMLTRQTSGSGTGLDTGMRQRRKHRQVALYSVTFHQNQKQSERGRVQNTSHRSRLCHLIMPEAPSKAW